MKSYYKLFKENQMQKKQVTRYKRKYEVTYKCLCLKQNGVNLSELIQEKYKKKINTIAIYGIGELGNYILRELLEENRIEVVYCLDQKKCGTIGTIPIFQPSEQLEVPDVILITTVGILKEIEDVLWEKMSTFDTMSVEELFG